MDKMRLFKHKNQNLNKQKKKQEPKHTVKPALKSTSI